MTPLKGGKPTAANWLFIIAVVLLVAGLFTGYGYRRRSTSDSTGR